jgi:hypothetical protein
VKYLEQAEQVAFFRLLETKRHKASGYTLRELCWSVPNAGTTGGRRGLLAGARRKAEGLTAGIPDIECAVAMAPHTGLHIELKRKDGVPSDVTQAQRDKMTMLTSMGRKCVVAFGAEDAWKKLCEYLSIKP